MIRASTTAETPISRRHTVDQVLIQLVGVFCFFVGVGVDVDVDKPTAIVIGGLADNVDDSNDSIKDDANSSNCINDDDDANSSNCTNGVEDNNDPVKKLLCWSNANKQTNGKSGIL